MLAGRLAVRGADDLPANCWRPSGSWTSACRTCCRRRRSVGNELLLNLCRGWSPPTRPGASPAPGRRPGPQGGGAASTASWSRATWPASTRTTSASGWISWDKPSPSGHAAGDRGGILAGRQEFVPGKLDWSTAPLNPSRRPNSSSLPWLARRLLLAPFPDERQIVAVAPWTLRRRTSTRGILPAPGRPARPTSLCCRWLSRTALDVAPRPPATRAPKSALKRLDSPSRRIVGLFERRRLRAVQAIGVDRVVSGQHG